MTDPEQGTPTPEKTDGHTMQVDVLGCIRSTQVPSDAPFLPVFEAVVNGIHSTQDRFGPDVAKHGTVDVHVHRIPQTSTPSTGRPTLVGITGFTIIDNGLGFTDANMRSFETAYSTTKADRGGKGLGRFSWLVLCREAHIASVFEKDGQVFKRTFAFRHTRKGIENFTEVALNNPEPLKTEVKLIGVQERFFKPLRRSTEFIVERLFEHCFDYIVIGLCPRIRVHDEWADGTDIIEVNERTKELSIEEPVDLQVGDHLLHVRHVQQPHKADRHHTGHLCAHHRVVVPFLLSQVSDLGADPIRTQDGRSVVHHVFVSGKILDDTVDTSRTRLNLAEDDSLFAWGGSLDLRTLRNAVGEHVNGHLAGTLQAERDENFRQIEHHIVTVQPEYKPLLRHMPEQLQRIRWTDNPRQNDENLYRVQQSWDAEVRRQQAEVEKKLEDEKADPDEVADELQRVIQQVNEAGQATLVRYVARRRAVLVFMRRLMSKKALEAHVHRIVFPMRTTSDDVNYDDHNLWLLDDTLAFYEFVASDLPFRKNRVIPMESDRRPDILAFKTGDPPYHHVALVELKRPERPDENPIQQLVDYAVMLRDGGAKRPDDTTIPKVPRNVRIDGYAVATLTAELEQRVRTGPGNMQRVEGDWRWVGGVPNENLTLELMDFSVFVTRAEQRNRAFFTKLGLP